MAMTSVRLLTTVLRKPDSWIGLWGVLRGTPSHKLCASWNRYFCFSSIKLKSNISSKNYTKKILQKVEDEEDSDEEDDHNEISEQEEEPEGDPNVVKDYKDLEKVVQSFRYDVILKTGLDIGRNKVEDAFYKGELRLNEEKLWKKSRTVKVGDILDLLIGEDKEAETETVMRILLKKVFEEKTESEKYRVVLRRWKKLKLPKKSMSK
ncbi:mitochondrial transcription rescue factor 1 isoform X2 [Cynocephalus volans]|uniref:mitochondrial transcription rescue factor 1 isoform X2 n=1 Tax=Cynocephalus volans TaxID=110931 RepID=UPI002FC91610